MSTQASYYAFPQSIDFGSLTLGNSLTQSIRIEYQLAPNQSVGGVLTSQSNVSNEIFAIDGQGSNAEDVVTLSTDNTTFYNRVNVSSFPATQPPNFITLYVKVNPDSTRHSISGDFIVYLTAVQNPQFQVPIHFRIVNGLYINASDVRQSMGDFGKQKVNFYAFHDLFTDSTFPLWTNQSGTWGQQVNGIRAGVSSQNPATDALSTTAIQDFGDYNVSAWVTLTTSGVAGLIFSFVNTNNYYRAWISTSSGRAQIDSVIGGTVTTLATGSVGGVAVPGQSLVNNSSYTLRVEKHTTSADFFLGEQRILTATGVILTGSPGLCTLSRDGTTTAYFQEYHVSEDVYQFDDASINQLVQEEQEFIEQRVGRVYSTQTITELRDWDERQPLRMPFLPARSFNMLPSGTQLMGTGTDQRVFSTGELAMYLRQRPVMNVISLEEDTAVDGSTPTWTLRTQGRNGDYVVYPEVGKIAWLNNLPNNGHQNIKIIYTVGSPKVPAYIKGYLKEKVALRLLENLGTGDDGIQRMVEKKERNLTRFEEYIPQKVLQYGVGSGQPIR